MPRPRPLRAGTKSQDRAALISSDRDWKEGVRFGTQIFHRRLWSELGSVLFFGDVIRPRAVVNWTPQYIPCARRRPCCLSDLVIQSIDHQRLRSCNLRGENKERTRSTEPMLDASAFAFASASRFRRARFALTLVLAPAPAHRNIQSWQQRAGEEAKQVAARSRSRLCWTEWREANQRLVYSPGLMLLDWNFLRERQVGLGLAWYLDLQYILVYVVAVD